ncbi:MAG: hypothetical protein HOP28_11795 [Gemmatimonadales bacterium]|nr:hypothetical protein [Gemmatimonadales bacterium]
MRFISTLLFLAALAPSPAAAQPASDTTKLPPAVRIPREREIALARSAAPKAVSDSAEIWVLGDNGFEKAVGGTSGYGCIVQRGLGGQHIIPRCDDRSGVESHYAVYQLIERMRLAGRTYGDARKAIADGFRDGTIKEPKFGGFSYMYSVDGAFKTPTGSAKFSPHVMIYWPNCNAKQLGVGSSAGMSGSGLAFIDYGTPECVLVVNTPPGTARPSVDSTAKP